MTERVLITHPDVVGVDLAQAVAYYRSIERGLAERLSDEFDAALEFIEVYPLAGRPLFETYRRVVLRHFPYLIAYAVSDEQVFVLAVVHGKRDPEAVRAEIEERALSE